MRILRKMRNTTCGENAEPLAQTYVQNATQAAGHWLRYASPYVRTLATLLLLGMLVTLCLPTDVAQASTVTDTISISIGYFGWEEDDYVEKCTFHWQELDDLYGGALRTHEMVYSYYSGSRTYLVAARGFYLKDLLEYAGIDFGSIARIDFFTKDQTVGAYRTFTKASLFDMPRYYYPNMAANELTGELYPFNGGNVDDGAVRVESMLALEDYTEWDSVGTLFERLYDKTLFSASSRFHLFFGQLNPTEANTSSAAKYVYRLLITFSGTPVLSADETNIGLKVGSDFRTSIGVSAEDSLLDDYVRDNLVWSSSDENIIAVDQYGNLTVRGDGEAVISASFGESTMSVTVQSGDVLAGGQGILPAEPDDESQTESSDGAGENGDADGDANGNAEASDLDDTLGGAAEQDMANAEDTPTQQYVETLPGVFILSPTLTARDDYVQWASSALGRGHGDDDGEGALLIARRERMAEDAQQLVLLAKEEQDFILGVLLVLAAFFASGFGYGVVNFGHKMRP